MNELTFFFSEINQLIAQGGWVLWVIFFTCLLLWLLIFERLYFYRFQFPHYLTKICGQWFDRQDRQSRLANDIRNEMVCDASIKLHSRLKLIQTLVALCPMLGLLGTVTGMVTVFEIISVTGTADAQNMADGVYRATIPTMAGLTVALSGYYFVMRLRQWADDETSKLSDHLTV
ncbi:MAG: MotA/TolQ/ExbB proton channel family protein [Gammaproteobacteria bacterium]|nr:MAG: MotA/TolQ/ExbB proton channel family protein [Gammaproteobacteria bacterium]